MQRLALVGSLLLLASCAPGVNGGDTYRPQVMASPSTAVTIRPGETKYVQYDYPRSAIRVNDQYFRDLKIDFNDRAGDRVRTPTAYAPWLKMTPASASGISVSLAQGNIVKNVVDTSNDPFYTNVQYYEQVRVILKVTASPSATSGTKTVALNFTDGNTPSTVSLRVNVQR